MWLCGRKHNTCSNTCPPPHLPQLPGQSKLTFSWVKREMLRLQREEGVELSHINTLFSKLIFLHCHINEANWLNSCVLSFITHCLLWWFVLITYSCPYNHGGSSWVTDSPIKCVGGGHRSWTLSLFWDLQGSTSIEIRCPNLNVEGGDWFVIKALGCSERGYWPHPRAEPLTLFRDHFLLLPSRPSVLTLSLRDEPCRQEI